MNAVAKNQRKFTRKTTLRQVQSKHFQIKSDNSEMNEIQDHALANILLVNTRHFPVKLAILE